MSDRAGELCAEPHPSVTVEECRPFAETTVEVLNHALSDVREDRLRYHICCGGWHRPHTTDLPLADVVASTDCGLGGRIHASLAWAKLGALARGSRTGHKGAVGLAL